MNTLTAQDRPFYRWILLAALATTVAINQGMTYVGAAVINAPMARELGLSHGTLGLGSMVFLLCLGLTAPLVGCMVNAYGTRATLCLGSLLVALGALLLATLANRGWHFVTFYGFFLGTGDVFGGMVAAQSCVTLWFEERRGTAFAMVLVGAGLGGSIAAPLFTRVIAAAHGNWRVGWYCIVAAGIMAALVSIIFVRDGPEEVWQAVGRTARANKGAATSAKPAICRHRGHWTSKQLLRTPAFWLLTLAAVGESAPGAATVAHAIPHLRELGHTAESAAAALGCFALLSIAGKLISGLACDRIEPRVAWAASILIIAFGVLVSIHAENDAMMYLFTGAVGFGSGAALTCWHATVPNYFGPASFPSVLCTQLPISNTIAAISPLLVGLAYDARHSYTPAFVALALFSALSAVLLYFTSPPNYIAAALSATKNQELETAES